MTFKPSGVAISTTNIINGEDVEATIANRPHDQAFLNTDQLASVLNADRNLVIRGGGVIGWASGAEELSFSDYIYISFPNEVLGGVGGAVEHSIAAGVFDFNPLGTRHTVAAIKISRTTNTNYLITDVKGYANMAALLAVIAAEAPASQTARFDYVVIAKREPNFLPPSPYDHVILWDGRRVRDGETFENAGATDSQYAQEAEFQAVTLNSNQDRNTFLVGGGILTWEGSGTGLKCTDSFYISMPHSVLMEISAATFPLISNGYCYVILSMDRTDHNTTVVVPTPYALSAEDVSKAENDLLVFAVCTGDRLYLMDGTVIEDGYRSRLGGLAQGVRWIFRGAGTGVASYDFTAVGGTIIPAGATPEYYPGGAELMVYVNGVLYISNYLAGGTPGDGDYNENAITTIPSTTIEWTPTNRPIPQTTDQIVAFVGLANPNFGPTGLDLLTLANSAGGSIWDLDVSTEPIREDDPTYPTVTFTASAPGVVISVGEIIADPVSGRRAQGVGAIDHGALIAYSQRPQVFFDHTAVGDDYFILSPGEVAAPLTVARELWLIHRLWEPLVLSGDLGTLPPDPGGFIYVYLDPDGTRHDAAISAGNIVGSQVPPIQEVNSAVKWLAHPSNVDWIYLGCYWAYTTGLGPTYVNIRPFDRMGDEVRYLAGSQPQVLSDDNAGVGWAGSGGQINGVDLSDYVPQTAHGAILQVQFDLNITDYIVAGGTDITGVAFYSKESTPPVAFPDSIADAHDVQFLVQPNITSAAGATQRFAFAPFTIPVNDLTTGIPSGATVDIWVGPYVAEIVLHVVGFVESQQHVYRHR